MYVTLADIRAEGFDVDTIDDDRAEFLSLGWQAFIEAQTGQWFESKTKTLLLDGNGSRVLWLPFPIIEIIELYVNNDFDNVVDTDYYTVYNRYFPDDRGNPRIKLQSGTNGFFSGMPSGGVFDTGDQNQKIVGTFGYVEEDGSTPFQIWRAIMTLIAVSVENMADGDIDALRSALVTEEVTDRHRIRFANLYKDIGQWSPTGIQEVDTAIKMYKHPRYIGMARRS